MNGDVTLEQFQLKKTKLKNGVVEVEYNLNLSTNGAVRHPTIQDKIEMPHPDLIKSIESFHHILVNSWGLDNENEQLKESVTVTGIDLSGKDEMRGVIITGKKAVLSGNVAMNSPRIRFTGSAWGFEEETDTLSENHKKEVFSALYEGKSAQLEIAFTDNEEPESDAENKPEEGSIKFTPINKRKK
jgi:hypothetical protein